MYLEFYGLKEKPFESAPDPKYFFTSSKHKAALSYLEYGFLNNLSFIMITGEPGTGKTILIKKFLSQVQGGIIGVITNTNLNTLEFIQAVLQEYNINYDKDETKAQLLDKLHNFLMEKCKNNQPAILVVDEAQNLSVEVLEELRMLSNFQTNNKHLLQIILTGQPNLRSKLLHPSLKQLLQRITLNYHLFPLDRKETFAYIKHRLQVAGAINTDIFSEEAIELIFEHSGGVPRLINAICDAALVYGFVDELKTITKDVVSDVIGELFSHKMPEIEETIKTQEKESSLTDNSLKQIDLRLKNLEKNVYELLQKTITLLDRLVLMLDRINRERR